MKIGGKLTALKMVNTTLSTTATLFLVALLCVSEAMASSSKLPVSTSSSSPAGGYVSFCKSMVEIQGYTCQEHKVTTKDGYILGLQRIPVRRSANNKTSNSPPVLLQHGLFVDASSWLLGSPNESLAFMLADKGFDVWLSNTRGTVSSRGHTSLGPQQPAYLEWSWDELVDIDLPALFQYVQHQTGQRLHYVGHSLGTLTAFAAFSENKLLDMLRSAASLSPIAYLGQISSPLVRTIAETFLVEKLYLSGVREFVPRGSDVSKLLKYACIKVGDCSDILTLITGPNCCIKKSTLSAFLEHVPQPTAMKNLMHLTQMVRKGTITKYDYGNLIENMKHYGQVTPPTYNMKNIPNNFPLYLSYGGKDMLSGVDEMQVLLDNLRDHEADKLVVKYIEDYAHVDFIMGSNARQDVLDPLIKFFSLH